MAFKGADVPKQIAEWTFMKSEGISTHTKMHETNTMLAERDYSVKCRTETEPLMIVHGIWIWFCFAHFQPSRLCDAARKHEQIVAFAEAVKLNDKTDPYEYGHYNHREQSKNAEGTEPARFQRWLTPKEMALNFLRDLKR